MRTNAMKKFIAFSAVALALAGTPAHAQFTKSTLSSQVDQQFPDNNTGAIAPSILRSWLKSSLISSFQQFAGVNLQAGTTYTIQAGDYGQLITFNNALPQAVTLPQAAGSFASWNGFVKNIGSGTVTITPAGGSLINGGATYVLIPGAGAWIVSDGTNYQIWLGGIVSLPIPVSQGGTGCSVASPTCLDNITGVSGAGVTLTHSTVSFDTVAAATAATIPATNTGTIYIRGFSAAGDAGGGFWTRSVSQPVPTARFQSADGAWWSPSLANGVFPFEMFGGQCGGSGFDNTPAMNKYNSFIATNGQQPTRLQPCSYFHNTAPNAFSTVPPYFQGTGINGTVLNRNYNGTAGVGFLNMTAASGLVIKDLQVSANAGTNTGEGLRFDASAGNGSSGSYLQNVTFVGLGTDNLQDMIAIDGHLKVTGSIGSRDHNWIAVTLFGSATSAVNGLSVEGFTWNGGGVYPAGGTSNAPILLTGLTAPMATNVVNINIAEGGDISLDQCVRCILRSSAWSNTLNTANTNLSGIGGNVPGTKQTNWTNSNYLAF